MHKPLIKVCGITRVEDALAALELGVDYLGVNIWEKTPRYAPPEVVSQLLGSIPRGKRVLVTVNPALKDLEPYLGSFDFFQLHFAHDTPMQTIQAWAQRIGRERLWLVPKCPPQTTFPEAFFSEADTFLVDAYKKDAFGGTGHTADWGRFSTLKASHPEKQWILAGGLSPENIRDALTGSGANFVDINSGIETAPGIKDCAKLKALIDKSV